MPDTELCCWDPMDSLGVRFDLSQDGSRGVLYLYGVIGWDVTPEAVLDATRSAGQLDRLDVHVHSPGGDAHDGVAIANRLRQSATEIVTWVDGLAASAASLIVLVGQQRIFSEMSGFMIHPPWAFTLGDGRELIGEGQSLLALEAAMIAEYSKVSGMNEAAVTEAVLRTTYYYGSQAVSAGWGTEIGEFEPVDIPLELPEEIHAPQQMRAAWGLRPTLDAPRPKGARFPAPWSALYGCRRKRRSLSVPARIVKTAADANPLPKPAAEAQPEPDPRQEVTPPADPDKVTAADEAASPPPEDLANLQALSLRLMMEAPHG